MSASGSDYVPSEHSDEDQAAPAPVLDDDGVTEDDYLSGFSTEEEGGTYFDAGIDPLAVIDGMEHSAVDIFELLRRRRRRSRRLADRSEDDVDEGDESEDFGFTSDEGAVTEEEGLEDRYPMTDEEMMDALDAEGWAQGAERGGPPGVLTGVDAGASNKADSAAAAGGGGGAVRKRRKKKEDGTQRPQKKDDEEEEEVKDRWDDALAEKLGMAPVMNRRRARNREKYRRRTAKQGTSRRRDLSEAAARKMGEANLMYARRDLTEAIRLLRDVVRLAPHSPDAYTTLGLLYEEVGDFKKSLDFSMIAAHLTPKDVGLWRRMADLSARFGYVRQTIYCLSQVIKRDREDVDARYERALLLAELSEHRKALEGLEAVRQARPADPEVAKHVARLYYRTSQHDKAAESLRAFMKTYPDATDLTHVNLLAELLCSSEISQWQEVIELMNTTRTQLLGEGEEMPVELMAKEAVARAHLGDVEGAAEQLKAVLAQPVDVFADVYAAAADAMEHVARDDLAEPFLRALATDSATAEPAWCQRLAENQRRLVGPAAATHVWQAYADALPPDHPYYMDVVVCLADALKHAGDDAGATAALRKLDGSLLAAVVEPGNEAPDGSQAVVSAVVSAAAAAAKVGGGAGATIAPATRTAETDLLHKAKLLKECGRRDLIVKLALPSLTGTLTALATDDKALDARRASNKTRGKPRERGGGVGGGGGGVSIEEEPAAVFVGYVTKHRRRSRKKPAPEGAETDEEGGGADAGQGGAEPAKVAPSGVEGMEADVEPAQPHLGSTREDAASNAPLLPSLLKSEEPFELMIDTCLGLLAAKRSDEARRLAQTAVDVLGKRCTNRRKRDIMRLMLSCACLESGDLAAALSALREPAKRWSASPFIWNTFSRVLIAAGGPRQTIKFLIPLRTKHPSSLPLTLELGHTFLQTGQYGAALNEYFQACRQAPDEPLVLLSTGAALLNLAASRFAPDRHANVVQAFAFIQEYARFRNDDAEAYYNVGRAAQQLTLNSFAVDMYKKALSISVERSAAAATAMDMDASATADVAGSGGGGEGRDAAGHGKFEPTPYQDVSVQDEAALRYCQSYDVAPEAAYNMALVLKSSDATALARKLMRQHLTF